MPTPSSERAVPEGVLTVEDVLIHELLAWRPRDQGDIASILLVGHQLDRTYLDEWIAFRELEARWAEAQRAAGVSAPG